MKKLLLPMLLVFLLAACAPAQTKDKPRLTIAATTYPVYLFATAITQGVDGVEVTQVINQPTSCLHDYTLSVNDMKALEGADLVALSGAGLESFLASALSQTQAPVVDCSKGIVLHNANEHGEEQDGHDHGGEEGDPHIWMDPDNAVLMLGNLAEALKGLDRANADAYESNFTAASSAVNECYRENLAKLTGLLDRNLITFHDGFHYFADAFHLTILKSIEEEEGAESSAREINEIVSLVEEYRVPAIFTEANGSDATAGAISRESGAEVYSLSMIMSGDGRGITPYLDAITANADTILEAMSP